MDAAARGIKGGGSNASVARASASSPAEGAGHDPFLALIGDKKDDAKPRNGVGITFASASVPGPLGEPEAYSEAAAATVATAVSADGQEQPAASDTTAAGNKITMPSLPPRGPRPTHSRGLLSALSHKSLPGMAAAASASRPPSAPAPSSNQQRAAPPPMARHSSSLMAAVQAARERTRLPGARRRPRRPDDADRRPRKPPTSSSSLSTSSATSSAAGRSAQRVLQASLDSKEGDDKRARGGEPRKRRKKKRRAGGERDQDAGGSGARLQSV